jgi:hypothetical protein
MLNRRHWMIKNMASLMDEMVFHKENAAYFRNTPINLWKLGETVGEASLHEITRRSE